MTHLEFDSAILNKREVLDIIRSAQDWFILSQSKEETRIMNYLYGLFDGVLYPEIASFEFPKDIRSEILNIVEKIKKES